MHSEHHTTALGAHRNNRQTLILYKLSPLIDVNHSVLLFSIALHENSWVFKISYIKNHILGREVFISSSLVYVILSIPIPEHCCRKLLTPMRSKFILRKKESNSYLDQFIWFAFHNFYVRVFLLYFDLVEMSTFISNSGKFWMNDWNAWVEDIASSVLVSRSYVRFHAYGKGTLLRI